MSNTKSTQTASKQFQDYYSAELIKLRNSAGRPIAILANAAFISSQIAQMVAAIIGPGGPDPGSLEERAGNRIGECLTNIVVSYANGFSMPDLEVAMNWVDEMKATHQSVFEALQATSQ